MSLQPGCQAVHLAWACFFVGPLLGILDMGERVRCLLRREPGCPYGLMAEAGPDACPVPSSGGRCQTLAHWPVEQTWPHRM